MNSDVCVVIASGPSLTREDVVLSERASHVVVVNDNFRIAPHGSMLYAADWDWWASTPNGHDKPNHALSADMFAGERWTCDRDAATAFGLHFIEHRTKKHPGCVWGSNSGIEAVLLAQMTFSPRKFLLLGFDMGATGESHWFGDHPIYTREVAGQTVRTNLQRTLASNWPDWAAEFTALAIDLDAAGVEVVNCSRKTTLTCFRRSTIEQEL